MKIKKRERKNKKVDCFEKMYIGINTNLIYICFFFCMADGAEEGRLGAEVGRWCRRSKSCYATLGTLARSCRPIKRGLVG